MEFFQGINKGYISNIHRNKHPRIFQIFFFLVYC